MQSWSCYTGCSARTRLKTRCGGRVAGAKRSGAPGNRGGPGASLRSTTSHPDRVRSDHSHVVFSALSGQDTMNRVTTSRSAKYPPEEGRSEMQYEQNRLDLFPPGDCKSVRATRSGAPSRCATGFISAAVCTGFLPCFFRRCALSIAMKVSKSSLRLTVSPHVCPFLIHPRRPLLNFGFVDSRMVEDTSRRNNRALWTKRAYRSSSAGIR